MAQYIYCNQKSSHHRMDVRVCLARCPEKEDCPDLALIDLSDEVASPTSVEDVVTNLTGDACTQADLPTYQTVSVTETTAGV